MPDATSAATLRDKVTLLTAAEVARLLRIPVKKVYSLSIPQVRISDRRVRYLASDVAAFVSRSRMGK